VLLIQVFQENHGHQPYLVPLPQAYVIQDIILVSLHKEIALKVVQLHLGAL
jgi:hypothetical protein